MPETTDNLRFLSGGGEMGVLTLNFNWSNSGLGNPADWPQSLKTTLGIILKSRFPMFLWWGPELLCFYNDAYRPSLGNDGKHPSILGMPAKEAWPEIWPTIKPLINQVITNNESIWSEDQLIPIYRNGKMEDVYWTFSYSPASGDDEETAGVLVTCTETTGKVIALKELEEKISAIAEGEERFRTMAENSNILIAVGGKTNNAIYFSKAWVDLTGRSIEKLLEIGWADLVHPEERERYINTYLDAFRDRLPFTCEFRILNKDGGYNWILANVTPRFSTDGSYAGYISSCADITEQLIIREQLKDSEERLQLLADNISQLVWMTDETGYIFWYNKRWYDYTGTTLEEMRGWGWEKVQHPDYLDMVVKKWADNIKSGEIFEMTFPLRSKNGEFRWFLTKAVPLREESGKIIRWFGSNTDITEQRQDELRKNDFIGMVSHELKTPLTSLTALIQVVNLKLKTNEDTFLAGAMIRADTQVKKMAVMINGFLNISRLESGKMIIDKRVFDLEELIAEIIKETNLTVSSHPISFEPGEPVNVSADRDKISSVISNLIGNAVKYSPNGKDIDIRCEIIGNNAQVSIRDQGIGVKPEDQQHLFDRYYRVENVNTKYISGFGIGLYLSAEIIQCHDGKIWVESEVGKGSIFYFNLPLSD